MTPGKHSPLLSHDPARVSLVMVIVRGTDTLAGSFIPKYILVSPGSSALRASTTGLCRTDPYRGPLLYRHLGTDTLAASYWSICAIFTDKGDGEARLRFPLHYSCT